MLVEALVLQETRGGGAEGLLKAGREAEWELGRAGAAGFFIFIFSRTGGSSGGVDEASLDRPLHPKPLTLNPKPPKP